MTSITQITASPGTFAEVRKQWGWFLLLGIIFISLGAIAAGNLFYATLATVFYVGILITMAGVMQILHSFRIRTWDGFLLWFASGTLYAAAGVAISINPLLASVVLTLMFAGLAIASGISRILLGMQARRTNGWGWIISSGVITTLAGLIVLIGWPINSVWLLGLLLSIDLIFQGLTMVGFACQLGTIP